MPPGSNRLASQLFFATGVRIANCRWFAQQVNNLPVDNWQAFTGAGKLIGMILGLANSQHDHRRNSLAQ